MYDTILLATDGSEDSVAATDHAMNLAASGATIHAVSVVETRTAYDNAIVDPEEVRENLRRDAREALDAVEEAASEAGVDCETTVDEGPPPERLLAQVEQTGADVVVLGATGRSGFKRLVLGSTTEHLLSESPVPVVVVGRGESSP
jgi:nucleotide-binding universal stress UspA family protein